MGNTKIAFLVIAAIVTTFSSLVVVQAAITASLDKPIYIVGDLVTISGSGIPNNYVIVQVRDRFDTLAFIDQQDIGSTGTYVSQFRISSTMATGRYTVHVGDGQSTAVQTTFNVSEKCPARVEARWDKIIYHVGDIATFTMKAYDAGNNLIPNTPFIETGSQSTQYTDANGVYTSSGDVSSMPPGVYTYNIATTTSGCTQAATATVTMEMAVVCPTQIDMQFDKSTYYLGDDVTSVLKIYDSSGNIIPNAHFKMVVYVNDTKVGESLYDTGSQGVLSSTSTVTSLTPAGRYKYDMFSDVSNCAQVSISKNMDIIGSLPPGMTTTTSTTTSSTTSGTTTATPGCSSNIPCTLTCGQTLVNQRPGPAGTLVYQISGTLPSRAIVVMTPEAASNYDLYTKQGMPPSFTDYTCGPLLGTGQSETCVATLSATTNAYVMVNRNAGSGAFNISAQCTATSTTTTATTQCVKTSPTIFIIPSEQSALVGSKLSYSMSVRNNDNSACGPSKFTYDGISTEPYVWWSSADVSPRSIDINPGSSASVAINVVPSAVLSGNLKLHFIKTNADASFDRYIGTAKFSSSQPSGNTVDGYNHYCTQVSDIKAGTKLSFGYTPADDRYSRVFTIGIDDGTQGQRVYSWSGCKETSAGRYCNMGIGGPGTYSYTFSSDLPGNHEICTWPSSDHEPNSTYVYKWTVQMSTQQPAVSTGTLSTSQTSASSITVSAPATAVERNEADNGKIEWNSCGSNCGCDNGYVYSNAAGACVKEAKSFDSAKLLETALTLQGLKSKFDLLNSKAKQISDYYDATEKGKSQKWLDISKGFGELSSDVVSIADYLRSNKDNLDDSKLENARSMIADIDSKLKNQAFAVLEVIR